MKKNVTNLFYGLKKRFFFSFKGKNLFGLCFFFFRKTNPCLTKHKKKKKKKKKKKERILFLKKKKDFFCFKNFVFSVLRKKKKIFTKPNKQVVCWFTKKKIIVLVRGRVLNPRPSIQMGNAQPQSRMLCCDISCKEYMIREKVF